MVAEHQNLFVYCPAPELQAWYATVYGTRRAMRTFQCKRVKIGAPAKCAGIFVTCMLLASCSSSQNAFFSKINELISRGYSWQKIERCRPAKKDALSIPLISPDGRKLVCYILVPPQKGIAASASVTAPAPSSFAVPTPTTKSDNNSKASGIVWNFSNFWPAWLTTDAHQRRNGYHPSLVQSRCCRLASGARLCMFVKHDEILIRRVVEKEPPNAIRLAKTPALNIASTWLPNNDNIWNTKGLLWFG